MRHITYCLTALLLADLASAPKANAEHSCPKIAVALDSGHSQNSPGATSARGKNEVHFNQRFTRELFEAAARRPAIAATIVPEPLYGGDLIDRIRHAERLKVDVFISIHHDSVNKKYLKPWVYNGKPNWYSDRFSGHSIFVSNRGARFDESLQLATIVGKTLRALGAKPTLHHAEDLPNERRTILERDLGIYDAPFVVLARNTVPSILLEIGIIVNREEEVTLDDQAWRSAFQSAILDGLDEYCRLRASKSN